MVENGLAHCPQARFLAVQSDPGSTLEVVEAQLFLELLMGLFADPVRLDDLMAPPISKPKALLADKRYDGDTVRANLLIRGVLPIILPETNRCEPIACDFSRYRNRNRIERMFGYLKHQRRIAPATTKRPCRSYAFSISRPSAGGCQDLGHDSLVENLKAIRPSAG